MVTNRAMHHNFVDNCKCRGIFRTLLNILRWSFLRKMIKDFQMLNIFANGSILIAWFLRICFTSSSLQGCNQGFFRAGKLFWIRPLRQKFNYSTWKKGAVGKIFYAKLRHFFQFSINGRRDLPPMLVASFVYTLLTNFMPLASFYTYQKMVTQLTFTCSKSTVETIEKGVKYVQN